jgi:hypothetical protein
LYRLDEQQPKRVKKNGTKYSIYQITLQACRSARCKIFEVASLNDSISADAAMERAEEIEYTQE